METSRLWAVLALNLTIAGVVLAQDKAKAPDKRKVPTASSETISAAGTAIIKIPGVEWTDEQKTKVDGKAEVDAESNAEPVG